MPDSSRVAVVIGCYNDGETLPKAVESAQSEPGCEVMVVDDGSTDGLTLEVFASLEADGVRVIHQKNQGIATARMAGVRATTSDYVFPLDADDFVLPGGIATLATYLDAHLDIDVTWGRYRYVGERNHDKPVAGELDPWLITYLCDIPVSALFRRRILEDAGGWSFDDAHEDWDLWMTLAERQARGAGVQVPVYSHRLHGVRRNRAARPREDEIFGKIAARHPVLFAQRRVNRRRSTAPRLLKVALPVLNRAPWPSRRGRRMSGAVLLHVAHRRGGYHRPFLRMLESLKARLVRLTIGTVPEHEA